MIRLLAVLFSISSVISQVSLYIGACYNTVRICEEVSVSIDLVVQCIC